ncbi:MAG: hypothetical protein H6959_10345 [Chromatiaceae bacterium]|nr:hypothetical protein [Gammaproteobacteria bacterium]MCP5298153.1 hypothetical protein [Chromatiaceae bacterium]MCP5423307.1 hypothetical protein [Chromatiaceae bacterium]
MRIATFLIAGLFAVGFGPNTANPTPSTADEPPGIEPSQLSFSVRLPVAGGLEDLVQKSAAASNAGAEIVINTCDGKKIAPNQRCAGDVGVKVHARPNAGGITLQPGADGHVALTVPIPADVYVTFSRQLLDLTDDTCKAKTHVDFRLHADVMPRLPAAGAVVFDLRKVRVDAPGFRCGFKPNVGGGALNVVGDAWRFLSSGKGPQVPKVPDIDIAARVTDGVKLAAEGVLAAGIGEFNAALPKAGDFEALLRRPAAFGDALSLGIQEGRIVWRRATGNRAFYTLEGEVEGLPWLQFGSNAEAPDLRAQPGGAKPGFRLPARLLFPTDEHLLPDPAMQRVSGCVGNFRLAPVPGRTDLSILQDCKALPAKNIIWLSGQRTAPRGDAYAFEKPIDDVLDQVDAWLDDRELWKGVAGIDRLKSEVAAFRRLLALFQQDTQIPIDTRGTLDFSALQLDLKSLWLTDEAIVADVLLSGHAKLDLTIAL